jgi:deoxyadenosine/deoxycytidine kinase
LNTLADQLAEAGHPEALDAAEEAVDLYRESVGLNRDAYLPGLAMSMNTLANRLADAGRRPEALDAAQEAANYYRELDDRYPGTFESSQAKNQRVVDLLTDQDAAL